MGANKFKKTYENASKKSEVLRALDFVTDKEKKELLQALELVDEWCGVTMRDEWLMRLLK